MDRDAAAREALYRPSSFFGANQLRRGTRIGILLFFAAFLWVLVRSFTQTPTPPAAVNRFPSTATAGAQLALVDFLECESGPIPSRIPDLLANATGEACTPTVINEIVHRRWTPVEGEGVREIQTFLIDSDRGLLEADVLVDVSGRHVVLAAIPNVQEADIDPAEVPSVGVPNSGVPGNFDSESVRARLTSWASAFLTRDGAAMLDVTAQRRGEVIQISSQSTLDSIISLEPLGGDLNEDVVRVRLVFSDTEGFVHSFDVFVDRLNEAQPSVAGWGAPGERAGLVLGN